MQHSSSSGRGALSDSSIFSLSTSLRASSTSSSFPRESLACSFNTVRKCASYKTRTKWSACSANWMRESVPAWKAVCAGCDRRRASSTLPLPSAWPDFSRLLAMRLSRKHSSRAAEPAAILAGVGVRGEHTTCSSAGVALLATSPNAGGLEACALPSPQECCTDHR